MVLMIAKNPLREYMYIYNFIVSTVLWYGMGNESPIPIQINLLKTEYKT